MKKIAFLLLACGYSVVGFAQNDNSGQNSLQSFAEFRNSILNNYSSFRQRILDQYADFLNGEWHEYESLEGLTRDETPKPYNPPIVNLPKPDVKPDTKPEEKPQPKPEVKPEPKPQPEQKPEVKPEPKPQPEVKPEVKPQPQPEEKPMVKPQPPTKKGFNFSFYNIPLALVDVDFNIASNLSSPAEFSQNWKDLEAKKIGEKMMPSIKKTVKELGLNDYLTYKFLESYVNSKFPGVRESSRMALLHYLLVNLEYDARIALSTSGTPLLLMPFKQTVYGRSYLMINNQRYYLFPPEGYDLNKLVSERILTCQMPSDADLGNNFDLVLGELNIPVKPKNFDLEYGPLHLSGELNENLIPILYRYPQMPIEDYAKSNIQPQLRKQLVAQIQNQLAGLSGDEDVEALLHFTQNAFQYATDDSYHGFEKPYFVEETLFYPKNDCEDRAIFYTYFLHNALGRETQLVSFPGHEAATVVLKQPKNGVYYRFNGKDYYISDPTYIGASTGMVMPSFVNVVPEVDYTYK